MVETINLLATDLSKSFNDAQNGEVSVLDGLSLEVKRGEIVALIGPSGCGKSTFLRLAAGLDLPDSGSINYNGIPITGTDSDRGFMFQDPNLFPWLTVYDNIAFGLKARRVYKKERSKVREYIDMMGLTGFEKAFPHQLSGGMASRTALARTFIQNPSLILLDEPLSALDAFTRITIQNEILGICQKTRPTIILVTHDIEEAVALSDRVAVLSARPSRIVEEVAISLSHPRDRTSAEFVSLRRAISDMLALCVT